jgi:excisionase family DNA binding protein
MRTGTAQQVEPAWLKYEAASTYSGLGRSTLWKLVTSGEVRAAKVGKRSVRISRASLDEYMKGRAYADLEE